MIVPVLSNNTAGGNGNGALADGKYALVAMAIKKGKFKKSDKTEERSFYVPVLARLSDDNQIVGVTTCYKSDLHVLRTPRLDVDGADRTHKLRNNSGNLIDAIQSVYDTNLQENEDVVWFTKILPGMFGKAFDLKAHFFTSRTRDNRLWTNHIYEITKTNPFNKVVDTSKKDIIEDFVKNLGLEKFGDNYIFGFGGEQVEFRVTEEQTSEQSQQQTSNKTSANDPFA